jgi:microcystin-dependent protein
MPARNFESDEKGHRANGGALEQLANQMSYGLVPIGGFVGYGGSVAPPGWLACNGATISRTTYAALFSVIGETFGAGDGSTTFELPTRLEASQVFDGGASAGSNGLILIRTGAQ